jgi:CubicO group peptidase (beta-lactamase class C family)
LHEGFIESLDDKVTDYLPEMAGTGYDGPTIRDLLRMRSGVAWQEIYQFGSDTQLTQVHDNALVAYNYRWCDYAANESVPGENEPGAMFNYATLDTSVLGCIVERVTGQTGSAFMSEKIWKPAGMESDAYWIMDGPDSVGREFFGAGFAATGRDHARFGLMFLNNGVANGKQVIPAEWVAEATIPDEGYEPFAPGGDSGYQYQWWTMVDSDAYMALGLHQQYIYIDPTHDLVIFKASHTPSPAASQQGDLELFAQITERLSN